MDLFFHPFEKEEKQVSLLPSLSRLDITTHPLLHPNGFGGQYLDVFGSHDMDPFIQMGSQAPIKGQKLLPFRRGCPW